ncbi:hypothetical protein T484DRAFT_1831501 [Baffinella frigidus]|nr:hypothetical protein T484DRAFT_1831501 [Cryptophyta sp. CCMP2293]
MSASPAISLYRAMLRAAQLVPAENKRAMAIDRIRTEFRKNAGEQDGEALRVHFLVGHTQLETLEIQAAHLTKIRDRDMSIIKGVRNTLE